MNTMQRNSYDRLQLFSVYLLRASGRITALRAGGGGNLQCPLEGVRAAAKPGRSISALVGNIRSTHLATLAPSIRALDAIATLGILGDIDLVASH